MGTASSIIGSALLKHIIGSAIKTFASVLKEQKIKTRIENQSIEDALNRHLTMIDTWSSEVEFKDLTESKYVSNIYVHLDYYLTPSANVFEINTPEKIHLNQILSQSKHVVILGQPGAGKTTSMKFICRQFFLSSVIEESDYNFPLLVRFRDVQAEKPEVTGVILNELFSILGLPKEYTSGDDKLALTQGLYKQILVPFLDELSCLIILDGFDEFSSANFSDDSLYREIETLSLHLKQSKIIVTSRTGEFKYSVANSREYEICPLSHEQVTEFCKKWLNDDEKAKSLDKQLQNSPFYDTALRPLTLAHLTTIYEREGKIPEKPKTVYKKVLNLLLEEWNLQRGIVRKSKFTNFEVDRKFDFLTYLAYQLTIIKDQGTIFSKQDLLEAYSIIHENFGLDKKDAIPVVNELESHNGLFIQTGYERFEFPHKSIQEYLAAEFIVKSVSLPKKDVLDKMPNELALAVAISAIPTDYFCSVVLGGFVNDSIKFLGAFINRIVTEKPDFTAKAELGIAFIQIFTLAYGKELDHDKGWHGDEGLNLLVRQLDAFHSEFYSIQQSVKLARDFYTHSASNNLGDVALIKKIKTPNDKYEYPVYLTSYIRGFSF